MLTVLGVGGGLGAAFVQMTTTETIAYTDPNGVAAPYTRTTQERAYFIPGIGTAAGFLVIGMIDAVVSANRSQRGADIVARPTRAATIMPLLPRSRNERGGVMVAVRF